jgi:hypothetical protein
MSVLKFTPVDLQEMQDEGVLMMANERFFWPLGLALTWEVNDVGEGQVVDPDSLHIRQWTQDGRWVRDSIEVAPDDEIANERRSRFGLWQVDRLAEMEP